MFRNQKNATTRCLCTFSSLAELLDLCGSTMLGIFYRDDVTVWVLVAGIASLLAATACFRIGIGTKRQDAEGMRL